MSSPPVHKNLLRVASVNWIILLGRTNSWDQNVWKENSTLLIKWTLCLIGQISGSSWCNSTQHRSLWFVNYWLYEQLVSRTLLYPAPQMPFLSVQLKQFIFCQQSKWMNEASTKFWKKKKKEEDMLIWYSLKFETTSGYSYCIHHSIFSPKEAGNMLIWYSLRAANFLNLLYSYFIEIFLSRGL